MGMNPTDDSFRRAGDVLQLQLLEEMRYLRKRLDTVIDGMATKESLQALSSHVDTEVRSLENRIDGNKTEMLSKYEKIETAIEDFKRERLPKSFWPTTAALATVLGSLATLILAWLAWHH